jgi:hypothetical protein
MMLTGAGCIVWYKSRYSSSPEVVSEAYRALPLRCAAKAEKSEWLDSFTSVLLPGSYPLLPPMARNIPQPDTESFDERFSIGTDRKIPIKCVVEITPFDGLDLGVVLGGGEGSYESPTRVPVALQRGPHLVDSMLVQLISLMVPVRTEQEYVVYYTVTYGDDEKGYHANYSYSLNKTGKSWSLFLPFVWWNLFTKSEADELRSIHATFLRDVRQDGYLDNYMKLRAQEAVNVEGAKGP